MDDAVTVYFPSVHGEAAGELIRLICFADDNLRGIVQSARGISNESARNILGASRYGESTSQSLMLNVSNPLFSGRSYGLALALADKILRKGNLHDSGRIIATGLIEPDGCGRITAVDAFDAKLGLLKNEGKKGDVFVFPAGNLKPNDAVQRRLLQQLKDSGIELVSLEHVSGGEARLWPAFQGDDESAVDAQEIIKTWNRRSVFAAALFLALAVVAALMAGKEYIRDLPAPPTQKTIDHGAASPVVSPVPAPQVSDATVDKRIALQQGGKQQESEVVTAPRQMPPVPVETTPQNTATTENKSWFIQSVDVPTDAY